MTVPPLSCRSAWLAAIVLSGLAVSRSEAAVYTYSAAADGNWSTTTNWTPNGTPNAAGDIVQKTQSTTRTVTQDIAAGVTVGGIQTTSGSFVVQTNNGITLNNNGNGAFISNAASTGNGLLTIGINSGAPAAGLTLADNLSITNTLSTNTNTSGTIKLNAAIGGTGNLTISNVLNSAIQGQIRIEAANTFTGTVGITKGAVTFNDVASFGNKAGNTITLGSANGGSVTLVSSSALGTSATGNGAIANNLVVASGTGGTTLLGSISIAASGVTSYTGAVALNGDLSVTSAQTTLGTGVILSGVISGTGKLTVTGTGVTTLLGAGVNTYTGDTLVSSGSTLAIAGGSGPTSGASVSNALAGSTLDASGGGTILFGASTSTSVTSAVLGGLKGSGNLALVNTNTTTPAAVALSVGNNNADTSYSGVLSGAGSSLTKIGTGRLVLAGASSYTGTTTISAGALVAGADAPVSANGAFGNSANAVRLGNSATTTNNSSAALLTGGAFTVGRAVTVSNQATNGTYTIGGGTDNNSAFNGAVVTSQNLLVSQVATTGTNALTISGGIAAGGGTTPTVTFVGPGAINVGTAAIANGSGTLAVSVTGGTTTFSAADTYTGATTISGGTLALDNNNTTSARLAGTPTITVNTGGTLLFAQSGTTGSNDRVNNTAGLTLIGGTLNLNGKSEVASATLSATSNGLGALTLTTNSTLDFGTGDNGNVIQFGGVTHTPGGGGVLAITNWDGSPDGGGSERLLFSGMASSFTAQFNQSDVTFNGSAGYATVQFGSAQNDASSYFEVVAVAVPESRTVCGAMLLVGVAGWRGRKRAGRLLRTRGLPS